MLRHAAAVALTVLYVVAVAVALAHGGAALVPGAVVLAALAARRGRRHRLRQLA
jgi:hypothetical protein